MNILSFVAGCISMLIVEQIYMRIKYRNNRIYKLEILEYVGDDLAMQNSIKSKKALLALNGYTVIDIKFDTVTSEFMKHARARLYYVKTQK